MAFLGARPVTALSPKGDGKTKIDMVLSEELTSAVKYDEELVVEAVHTWLQNLSRPEDINDVDEDGNTVLILCILAGGIRGGRDDEDTHTNYLTAIRWLLKRGADVTIADQRGWTPLHRACNTYHKFGRNVIPQLLAAGADIDAKETRRRRLERPLVLARRAQEDRSIVGLLRPRSLGHSSHGSLDNADRNQPQPGQIARGEGRRIANVPVFIPRHRAARGFGKLHTRVRNN